MFDTTTSNAFRTTYACMLVEIDISKGLPEMISLDSPLRSWNILLDYEGIPFRYRKCHMIGHLVASCSSGKFRPKKSPSSWKGVLDDHYTILKVPSVGDSDSPQDTLVVDCFAIS